MLLKKPRLKFNPGLALIDYRTTGPWGPFQESPVNLSGPKSNIQIEIKRIRARVLASKLLHFVSLTDVFILFRCKTIEIFFLHVNNNSFMGSLIIGTFEKRVPELFPQDNACAKLGRLPKMASTCWLLIFLVFKIARLRIMHSRSRLSAPVHS